jgi:hypothetical protein
MVLLSSWGRSSRAQTTRSPSLVVSVPWLFQTRAYAEAITETYPETTAEVAKERLDGRMDRQAI